MVDDALEIRHVRLLQDSLDAKASASQLATVNANLTQAIVTSQTTLEEELDKKASTQELVQAIATREPTITEGSLAQSKIQNLTSDFAAKASSQQLADGLAAKQNTIVDDSLEIRHVRFLQDSLDSKQALLGDVPGTGISLRYGTKLRKVFGHGGITVTHSLNQQDINDPTNFQLRISGEQLQPLITAEAPLAQSLVHGLADALNTASTSAVIADGSLTIAKTNGLQEAQDARMTISAVNNSLNYKQD